ncbi:MAG: dppB 4 [Frankiales bacterium]|nr:dppB 4 [Frankiales bacterium]
MTRYLVRRVLALIALLFAVLVVTFVIFFSLQSNPALKSCGRVCSPERLKAVEHKFGLDKSQPEQFVIYLKGFVEGRDFGEGDAVRRCPAPCLGYSFKSDVPVLTLIESDFPVTLSIAVGAAVLWLLMGVVTGVISALRAGTRVDRSIVGISTATLSLPTQLVGYLLLLLFCVKGGVAFPHYVRIADSPWGWFTNLLLPWITLAIIYSAVYTRLTRSQMMESMQEDFIRTARGKGLSERKVTYKHGARAALPPLIVIFGLDLGGLLGGAFVTERIFGMPGLGNLAVKSIVDLDLPVILGVTIFGAFFILVANLVADIAYALTDPKVVLQ